MHVHRVLLTYSPTAGVRAGQQRRSSPIAASSANIQGGIHLRKASHLPTLAIGQQQRHQQSRVPTIAELPGLRIDGDMGAHPSSVPLQAEPCFRLVAEATPRPPPRPRPPGVTNRARQLIEARWQTQRFLGTRLWSGLHGC